DASGWSATRYNKSVPFVYSPAFTAPVLELLSAKPGDRIIDFGCGSGEVSLKIEKIVREGGGIVVGVDSSESMITKAKANGLQHAFISDIQALELPENLPEMRNKFDVVFSNASLHWCKTNPRGVLESAKSVLKPGGRFVGEMGGFMNCIGVRLALHHALKKRGLDPVALDPWYFPSMEDYLLVKASFEPVHLSLTPRITPLPAGLFEWLNVFVRHSFLRGMSEEEATKVMREVEDMCRTDCQDKSGKWAMVYMRLRFSAILK
ncbi:cyclopropane-fatty-acyl-phospholipid synthase, partial [Infundibulicybe gibba]